eukprot:TRINITY_DN21801_c0_g1_i1.p1 TRINITY_DN21801_c0_g1~~TRINITY_DN21801_c0_g1_i1.p1  ORF type:complete len:187 (+),score=17.71 TRINITY_DN21801_c0_g1_i1:65-625(+)
MCIRDRPEARTVVTGQLAGFESFRPHQVASARGEKIGSACVSERHHQLASPNMSHGSEPSVTTCLVCFDKMPDAVFMNCGHGGVCYECSLEIWKKTGECYLCRNKIEQILHIDPKAEEDDKIKVISATNMIVNKEDSVNGSEYVDQHLSSENYAQANTPLAFRVYRLSTVKVFTASRPLKRFPWCL